jgi:hypothetical protein
VTNKEGTKDVREIARSGGRKQGEKGSLRGMKEREKEIREGKNNLENEYKRERK